MLRIVRGQKVIGWLTVVMLVLGLAGAPQAVRGQARPTAKPYRTDPTLREAFQKAVRQAGQSTVEVLVNGKVMALGAVVNPDGYIITKASEVKGPAAVRLPDGAQYQARAVGRDEAFDLLLLRIPAKGLKPVEWGSGDQASVGTFVIAPKPGGQIAAVGIVSVAARDVPAKGPGSYPNPNVGYLGVTLQDTEDGPTITSVLEGSPAEKAGLLSGDVIYSLAGQRVRNVEGLLEALRAYPPGARIRVVVLRDQEFVEKQVTLGQRPRNFSRAEFQNRLGGELSEKRSGFPRVLQHDAVLQPKDCGGPLVNLDGRVIGINIARAGRTESYAIPAETVQKLLPELMRGKGMDGQK
ncbi:hypothetical protein HRbin36_01582 [bacterium HR36]|nr:hypothetical protein HRbin36_01582 [bacterium HR36]